MDYKQKYKEFFRLFVLTCKKDRRMFIRMAFGVLFVIVGSAFTLLLPWTLKFIVDYFDKANLFQMLIVAYGLMWLISKLLIESRQIIVYKVFTRVIHKFASRVFQKILRLPLKYYLTNTTGGIMSGIERAQMSILAMLLNLIFVMIPLVLEVIIVTILLWCYYVLTLKSIINLGKIIPLASKCH